RAHRLPFLGRRIGRVPCPYLSRRVDGAGGRSSRAGLTFGRDGVRSFGCGGVDAAPRSSLEVAPMSLNEVCDQEVTRSEEEDVRVLFVEDDPAVAQMYKLKLE